MNYSRTNQASHGFTIVELLIVIVVIGILAAITIVAYSGIQDRARVASLLSDLDQSGKQLETQKLLTNNSNQYPADLAAANLKSSSNTYAYNALSPNGATNAAYCLTVANGSLSYFITSLSLVATPGSCSGLVGWWPMNGNGNDLSGNGSTGTVNGAISVAGQNGSLNGAYSFNGTSNDIALPANGTLDLVSNFSVSAWVNSNANIGAPAWNDIVAGNSGDWGVGIAANTSAVGYLNMTKINYLDAPMSTLPVPLGSWCYLMLTYSAGSVGYYLNGKSNGNVVISTTLMTSLKRIGSRNGSGYFHGAIDDVRVYNRALSAGEVATLYAAGAQ